MKVSEYLNMVAGIKGEVNKENVMQIVKDVSLEDKYLSKVEELSRGYKQRVGLAASLISEPGILILDEPTSGLDPIEQEKIKNLIKKISKNKTIIFSTHILSEVEDVATRLVIINKGQIVYDGEKPKQKGGTEKLFKKLVK
jgi:ABC-2 type transport system ATP-binding protein